MIISLGRQSAAGVRPYTENIGLKKKKSLFFFLLNLPLFRFSPGITNLYFILRLVLLSALSFSLFHCLIPPLSLYLSFPLLMSDI